MDGGNAKGLYGTILAMHVTLTFLIFDSFYEDARAMKPYSKSPASNRNEIEIYHLKLDADFTFSCFVSKIGKALSDPITTPIINTN